MIYPHVFDGLGWKNAVALLYRVHGIPQVYLLDSQLKIVTKNLRGPQLENQLRDLLGPGDGEAAEAVDKEKSIPQLDGLYWLDFSGRQVIIMPVSLYWLSRLEASIVTLQRARTGGHL